MSHGPHGGAAPVGPAEQDACTGPSPFGGAPSADPRALRVAGDPSLGGVAERVRLARVTTARVDVAEMAAAVADPRCGAVVTFDGVVRDHDGGRGVTALEYSAHPSAEEIALEVAREIAARYADARVALAHRYGPLAVGESALVCAVAAPHRKMAFVACDDLVDTVKRRLPIWKHQRFADGTDEWVGAIG